MYFFLDLLDSALWVVIPFTFLATIRLSLQGIVNFPGYKIIRFFFNEGWCLAIITFIPWHVSAFACGDVSPLPWQVFAERSALYGTADGIHSMLIICIVDLWLLWTPAQMYANKIHYSERDKVKFARIINGLAGLLLLTPGNPFYKLITLL